MKGAFISAHKCTKHVFFSVEAEKKCPPFPPDAFLFLQNTEISGKIGKNIIRKVFDIHDTCTFYLPRQCLRDGEKALILLGFLDENVKFTPYLHLWKIGSVVKTCGD